MNPSPLFYFGLSFKNWHIEIFKLPNPFFKKLDVNG
jgi:hypothetical protein